MPKFIGRDEVRRLVAEQHAVVAEVLPRAEYEWAHLPGAFHVPLKGWTVEQIEAGRDRDRPLMYERPTTVRPSEELGPFAERMRRADVDGVLVTRSGGTLLGMLKRDVAQQELEETDDADR